MRQVIPFDISKGGNIPLYCLANTCKGYSIPNRYASAWQAWLNTEQHTDPIPEGLDVPVYFSYTATIDGVRENYGHIGVRLADGRFWSDGRIFSSLEAYTSTPGRPVYVGWGESINEVKIIEVNSNMYQEEKPNGGDADNRMLAGWRRKATEEEKKIMAAKGWKKTFYEHDKAQYEWLWKEIDKRDKIIEELKNQAQFVPYTGKELFTKVKK